MTLHRSELLAEPHHQALEVQCAKALGRGDVLAAFRLADRRCRVRPLPDANCFVLRAEALYQMGERPAALEDLLEAIHIAPEDVAANRRLLAWGAPHHQTAAAMALIDHERDIRILRQAIAALRESGRTAVASLRVYDDIVEGWSAWQGTAPIRVVMTDTATRIERVFDTDPRHPLSREMGNAAAFRLPRSRTSQLISVVKDDDIVAAIRTLGDDQQQVVASATRPVSSEPSVTVIVPIYADYHATMMCLESLLAQLDKSRHQVILVNDASPDPRIHRLLDEQGGEQNVRVITNSNNLGFVGAVNRALGEVPSGDVILLNSDTIVPPGIIDRLASAAQSSSDIATVTPLSNNGEFTSFPTANRANAIEELDVPKIDGIAARVNAGRIVDIPNGIGFCLYITRACLDIIGGLSDSYRRGYLEDVDFCLRARQRGLRNVCATSVFVGHAGSRSFGSEKRSLVVRNLKVLEERFPTYRTECADFIRADPLRAARQAIETGLIRTRRGGVLLVALGGAVAEVARARAKRLGEGVEGVLILEIEHCAGGTVAKLRDPNESVPQSIDLALPSETDELMQTLRQLALSRVELFDLARLPRALVEALLGLSVPYDLFLAHAELGLEYAPFQMPQQTASNASFWRNVLSGTARVLVPDAQAEMFAVALPSASISRFPEGEAGARRPPVRVFGAAARIGLVTVRGCAREHALIRQITVGIARDRPELDLAVIGTTHDDPALMRAGAFVSGAVSAAELPQLFERYRLDRLVVCTTRPLFGHPILDSCMSTAIPVACFDWSGGQCPVREGDLALDPSLSTDAIAGCLVPWLAERAVS